MENKLIALVERTATETQEYLKIQGYELNDYLKFNLFIFTFMIERRQITNYYLFEKWVDYEELHLKFSDLLISHFKNINLNDSSINKYISFKVKHSLSDVNGLYYKMSLDKYINHKEFLVNDLFTFLDILEREFENVRTSIKNYRQNRKLVLPYELYNSFFHYPTMFLMAFERCQSKGNLFFENDEGCYYFVKDYGKLTNRLQVFLHTGILKLLKESYFLSLQINN